MTDKEFEPLTEAITGISVALIVLIRKLDAAGVVSKKDYVDDLTRWVESQAPETQEFARYAILRTLIAKLSARVQRQ